jgi:hypothetical protein
MWLIGLLVGFVIGGVPAHGAPVPGVPNPLLAWLAGGNTIARIGAVILFFGVAFLVKYAADQRVDGFGAGEVALEVGWLPRQVRSHDGRDEPPSTGT